MNRLKNLIPLFALAIFTLPAMANVTEETATNELRTEVAKALGKLDLGHLEFTETTVNVNFMVNDKNQIIVVSTNDEKFDYAIKSRLNYRTLETVHPAMNKLFTLPVKVKSQ